MDVAADRHGGIDGDDIPFFDEQFARFIAEFADLGFGDGAAGAQLRYGSGRGLVEVLRCKRNKSYLSRSLIAEELMRMGGVRSSCVYVGLDLIQSVWRWGDGVSEQECGGAVSTEINRWYCGRSVAESPVDAGCFSSTSMVLGA